MSTRRPFSVSYVTPWTALFATITSHSRQPKRTSPPSAITSSRKPLTTADSLSVPIWGFADQRISSGAPLSASSKNTLRMSLLLVPVVSFPSENVPAPPSPNWTLEFSSSRPVAKKRCTSAVRVSTSCPRSSTIGRSPARASVSAAKKPAGPNPAITGRKGLFLRSSGSSYTYGSALLTLFERLRRISSSSSPVTSASTLQTKKILSFLRLSTAFFVSRTARIRLSGQRKTDAAAVSSASSPTSSGSLISVILIMRQPFYSCRNCAALLPASRPDDQANVRL